MILQIKKLDNISWNAGPGESYHRRTHKTIEDARASRDPWILASTRQQQNLDKASAFIDSHGELGKQVWRFEFCKYKRVLRTTFHKQFKPVRQTDKEFFRSLYRLNAEDWDDWQPVLDAAVRDDDDAPPAPRPPMKREPTDGCTQQYLLHVFKVEACYSVRLADDAGGDDVAAVVEEKWSYFQVVDIHVGAHRAKIIKTLTADEQDEIRDSPFALSIQYMDIHRDHGPARKSMYFDTDILCVHPFDIAPWERLAQTMQIWDQQQSETKGCFDLVNPRNTWPTLSLMDAGIPVVCILRRFWNEKWKGANGIVKHEDLTKHYDSRKLVSKRLYLQVLLSLKDRLVANKTITSNQVNSYYQLVLKDVPVEPSLGDAVYKRMLDPSLLALPAPAVMPAIADGAMDSFDVIGDAVAKRKAAPRPKLLALMAPPGAEESSDAEAEESSGDEQDSSSSSAKSSTSFDVVCGRGEVSEWHDVGANAPLMKVDRYKPRHKAVYVRFIAKCRHHPACMKKRSSARIETFGRSEPIAYLAAWEAMGKDLTAVQHGQRGLEIPSLAVGEWVVLIGDKAEPLLAIAEGDA